MSGLTDIVRRSAARVIGELEAARDQLRRDPELNYEFLAEYARALSNTSLGTNFAQDYSALKQDPEMAQDVRRFLQALAIMEEPEGPKGDGVYVVGVDFQTNAPQLRNADDKLTAQLSTSSSISKFREPTYLSPRLGSVDSGGPD